MSDSLAPATAAAGTDTTDTDATDTEVPGPYLALGRDAQDSVESILADDRLDFGDTEHALPVGGRACFTWEYGNTMPALHALYERAKTRQWNANDLPWETPVDPAEVGATMSVANRPFREFLASQDGSPLRRWGDAEWERFGLESFNHRLSQFLHGEQGALICTAKIVETVPWLDAKYYAATQVMDEARHVEVFARYLDTKLDGHYPVNPALQLLIDDVIRDDRWDITYLGMQVMIEGLALAAFGMLRAVTPDVLLRELLRYVMADEARHVAFGVLSLKKYYAELGAAEIRERQEFALDAALRMRDRIMMHAVWERMGIDRAQITRLLLAVRSQGSNPFQAALFSKIVPNCSKLGILDAGDGWLRDRFGEMGVLGFEHAADTVSEYESFEAEIFV